ncbi:MAG TPA: cysteine hydrolase [Eoetvoesiella sp.]|jgi:nicotinamidase-related amidase|uniref:cysteine hydrolase family protein n=1 Tax=Eoetvoesiella sp. TaxID=1966355 RepID=UPI002CF05854|nr:cysteine hydrolase [Eoetvoesiella sp.]HWK62958.1 cysteine hydrolase [Eoetvoesiella sp.]
MPATTALIALHYQNDVLHPDGKIRVGLSADSPVRQNLVEAAGGMLRRARACGMPIVHVRIAFRPDYADLLPNMPIMRNTAAIQAVVDGSWGASFYEALAPDPGNPREFVVKHTRINAFFGTPLEEILRIVGASRVLIAGVATHSVVEGTVRHAADAGYEVLVAAPACASANPATHQAALDSMSLMAEILDADALSRFFDDLAP